MPVFLLSLLSLIALQSKPAPETAASARLILPKNLVSMVDRARSVSPEFGADALLRIAAAESVTDAATKRELIEEAFRLGGAAQEPMKRRGMRPGSPDTRVSFLGRAYSQDLDVLTLQSTAVIQMLSVDKRKARELFGQIAPPHIPKLLCSDTLVYDVSAYYTALAEVAGKAFTAKERSEDEHAKSLAAAAGRISSVAEVGPMARAIATVPMTPDQLQMVVTVFGGTLKGLTGDDRSFSAVVSNQGSLMSDLDALVSACKRQQVSSIGLVDVIRGFLVRQLHGRRCWDTGGFNITTSIAAAVPQPQQIDAVTFFNSRIKTGVFPAESQIAPLEGDEILAASVEDPVSVQTAWQGKEVKDLADRYNGLLFDTTGAAWTNDQKNESVWQSRLREYLAALAAWSPGEDVSPAEYFVRKCYLLSSLINVVPSGPMRELVLRSYMDFLQQNTFQQSSRMEWFLPVNTLMLRVMTDPALAGLAEEMRNSGDAVISLYAQLDTILPRSPAKVMGLL
jgi:hypothetical protein